MGTELGPGQRLRTPRGSLAHLRRVDPPLGRVVDRVGPFAMRVGRAENALAALVRSIVYQQLTGKAAGTIHGRFRGLFEGVPTAAEILRHDDATLRGVGLSRQKVASIRDLCSHAEAGVLPLDAPHTLDDEDLVERLTKVRGIGRWSAEIFLMFHLGRVDVWPADDLGLKKGMAGIRRGGELPDRRRMMALGERYRPFRTVAAWYLWRSLDPVGGGEL